jgi:signal transduction histidine kinase/DNA-binding LacI/PurR family transcriptional regulator
MTVSQVMSSNRKTIGVFVARVGRVWGVEFLAGVMNAAEAHDVNVVCFVGGQPSAILTPGELQPSYGLYDLALTDPLAGILMAADIGHGLKPAEIKQFCEHFPGVPLVANALNVRGIPNLLADNLNGMRSVTRHLIVDHGYKKIAFIRGIKDQVEAEQRFYAYKEELRANNIPFDESLIVQGDYTPESGRAAIRILLDERKVEFDAIAAANDRMAFGAMEALQSRGILVPGQVAVTGFDDVREARALGVPLTTVRQSFYDTGKQSLEMLLDIIDGNRHATQVNIPTELVVRWSCGCLPRSLKQANLEPQEVARTGRLENKRDSAIRALVETSGLSFVQSAPFREISGQVWDTFLNVIRGFEKPEAFLNGIEQAINVLQKHNDDPGDWHNMLSTFRRHALAGITDRDITLRAENLFQQARMLVGELSQRYQAYQRLQLEQQEEVLQAFSFSMAPAMALKEIGNAVQLNFPNIGIERMYVMFYDEMIRPQQSNTAPSQQYHMFMQYQDGQFDLFSDQPQLTTGRLIPHEKIPTGRRYAAVVMPLSLARNRFGFVWIEMGPRDWEVYTRVRNLLSSALLRTMLVEQREFAQQEVERLLDEAKSRANELDRLYQLEQERRKDAEALSKAARALSTSLKMDEVPQQILIQLANVLPYERGSLMMETLGTVNILAQHGFPQDPRVQELRVPIERGGVYDKIARSGEAIIIDDVTADEGWIQQDWLPVNHSWMGVPLFSKNKVIGMLSLTRKEKAGFSEDDLILVTTYAMQAAIALENARLYDESQKFNELMERMVSQRVEELNSAYTTLEKLDKNKTSFIQVAAHELRTPITVIKGNLGMLKTLDAIKSNEGYLSIAESALRGTDRLLSVVNAMLDVAKLEGQTIVPHMEPVMLGFVIQLVHKEYKRDLEERNIQLVTDKGIGSLPMIMADSQLVQKALDSVIVNAIKYTPDGGTVTVSASVETDERQSKWLEIRVKDTGIGIDPANHKVIFEKLHQVGKVEIHSSGRTKFKGGGPGLGLAIAAGIVKAHHGKIWVESPGYDEEKLPGSTFFIRLPMPRE